MILLAMIPENPVVGGTVLRRAAIQSPNFVSGSAGWSVNQDGTAEFNNLIIRNGQIISGSALYYSPSPGFGNLIASVAAANGTDNYGNAYLAGEATYQAGAPSFAGSSIGGILNFYTAPGAGGPWTQVAQISSGTADLILASNRNIVAQQPLTAPAATISGTGTAPVLTITNATNSGGGTVSITAAAAGNPVWLAFVSGDAHARLRADVKTNGGAVSAGNGTNSPDTSIGRAAANQWASDYIAFDSTGGQVAEPWQAVTFANGWTNGLGITAGYRRVAAPDHCVQWIGDYVTPAGLAAGQAVLTAVPAAYRPITVQPILGVDVVTGGLVRFTMTTAGVLTYQSGSVAGHDVQIPASALVQLTQ